MKHKGLRYGIATFIIVMCLIVMAGIYRLSSENGEESNLRSEVVTEAIRQEVNTRLNERGVALSQRIKYFVIAHSPYGSDWNANIRKVAHFSIYALLACVIYIILTVLGMGKTKRFILTMILCFLFALGDELHQRYTGRTSSLRDVLIDTAGAFTSCTMLTLYSWFCLAIRGIIRKSYHFEE